LSLSVLAATNHTLPGDLSIMNWLQKQPLPGQDLSDAVRTISGAEVVVATGAALSLVLWLRGYRRQAVLLVIGLALLTLLQPAIKELVDRPRPDPDVVDIRAGFSSPSFPSGHVMSGTYLYGFLLYLSLSLPLTRGASITLAIASAVTVVLGGLVNVWLGVHWPSDALGGWLWSGVILLPLILADRFSAEDSPENS